MHKLRIFYGFFHLIWYHFYKKYGPIVGIRVGHARLVIISGRDAVREFYNTDAMNGRPNGFFYRIRSFNKRLGVVFSDGDNWDVQRKFSLKILRQMGMGRANMIEHIEHECNEIVQYFKRKSENDDLIEMQHAFDIPVLNILWTLVAGYRLVICSFLDLTHPFQKHIQIIHQLHFQCDL